MWQAIADNTNQYAHKKQLTLGADALQQMENPHYKPRMCLNDWKDVSSNDMKLFVSYLLIMGL